MNYCVKYSCLDEICHYIHYSEEEWWWIKVSDIQPALFGRFLWKSPKIFYWAILYMVVQAETLEQSLPTPLPAISSTSKTFSLLFRARKLVADLKIWSWFFCPHTNFKQLSHFFSLHFFRAKHTNIFKWYFIHVCVSFKRENPMLM